MGLRACHKNLVLVFRFSSMPQYASTPELICHLSDIQASATALVRYAATKSHRYFATSVLKVRHIESMPQAPDYPRVNWSFLSSDNHLTMILSNSDQLKAGDEKLCSCYEMMIIGRSE